MDSVAQQPQTDRQLTRIHRFVNYLKDVVLYTTPTTKISLQERFRGWEVMNTFLDIKVATIHRFYCTTNDDTPKTTAHNGAGMHLKLWDIYVQSGT